MRSLKDFGKYGQRDKDFIELGTKKLELNSSSKVNLGKPVAKIILIVLLGLFYGLLFYFGV